MRLTLKAALATLMIAAAGSVHAAGEAPAPHDKSWSFEGFFGTYDRAAVQRGFQVYKEVCASCHGVKYLAFRNLTDIGLSEDQARAIAADYTVTDGPNDEGDMFERTAILSDRFPRPFANEQAAAAANGGKAPPDLSLMVKARPNGADYLYSLLVGYEEPPADFEMPPSGYYNEFYPGHVIAMAQPLYEDSVEYADGTPATVSQMAEDVTYFLAWAAEPKLEERKQTGIKVLLFLLVLSIILYAYKRKIWADVH